MASHTYQLTLAEELVEKHDHSPAVLPVVRYGLPLVILIFYISASWNFSYTPDSSFLSLRMARNIAAGGFLEPMSVYPSAAPNPLWAFFLAVADLADIDALLAAKVFSLFFASVVVLLAYLLASELLRDRFPAFCAALGVATSGLLLQAAPSGTALPVMVALVLAGLFFMLRNEYVVAAIMLGLGTLLSWQVVGAFLILMLDAWANATTDRHRLRAVLISVIAYLCAIAPWFVFAALRPGPPVPWLVGLNDFPGLSLVTAVAVGIPALGAVAATAGMNRHKNVDGLTRESHLIVVLWACWFLVCCALWGWDFYLFALPVIIIYALSSVQQHAHRVHSAAAYGQALLLTGVVILLHQLAFNYASKPAMAQTEKDSEELVELAYWIKDGVPDDATVSANRPERLAYYAGRPVGLREPGGGPATEYVVTEEEDVWGYDMVHRASRLEEDDLVPGAGRFAVWRKR